MKSIFVSVSQHWSLVSRYSLLVQMMLNTNGMWQKSWDTEFVMTPQSYIWYMPETIVNESMKCKCDPQFEWQSRYVIQH